MAMRTYVRVGGWQASDCDTELHDSHFIFYSVMTSTYPLYLSLSQIIKLVRIQPPESRHFDDVCAQHGRAGSCGLRCTALHFFDSCLASLA